MATRSKARRPAKPSSKASRKTKRPTRAAGAASETGDAATEGRSAGQRALGARVMAASFGEIVSVLMRSPNYRHHSLTDLEWLILPAVRSNQILLAGAQAKDEAVSVPVAAAWWAWVSPETDARLSANPNIPLRLAPDEWSNGEILWLFDAVGPQKLVGRMVEGMRGTVFAGKDVKTRIADKDGSLRIVTLEAKEAMTEKKSSRDS